ncbi:MAG: hypothetical protein KKC64_01645 [Spirochaetes bacterium]|nr:hypothetical protein [Spirochaetota bacterium]
MKKHHTYLFLVFLFAAILPLSAQRSTSQPAAPVQPGQASAETASAELPVSRVSLFTSGVGYFEHAATVNGNASFRMMFSLSQINDVLKSMVLRDLDGGTVNMVQYPSSEPLARALQSFALNPGTGNSMAQLLQQVRGVAVTVYTPTAVHGRLLGLETRRVPAASGTTTVLVDETLLNLVTETGLRSIALTPGIAVKLNDEALNAELNRALDLILESNDPNRKPVDLSFTGSGSRRVRVAYVSETPVWKTSYRLDLSDGKPFLQGWAIVENNSEFDWENISLSLVAGRPISFIQDLYTSLYNKRPVIASSVEAAPAPQAYAEGRPAPAPSVSRSAAPAMESHDFYVGEAEMAYEEQKMSLSGSGVAAAATAERAGELFAFTIKTPVNLPRRQSAMLPLYNGAISAEKLSIFSLGQSSQYPLNGARIINSSGLQLPAGPITVFDGGLYAGDALITTFIPDDKRLISYAVDQTMLVQPQASDTRNISAARISNGVLTIETLAEYTQTYSVTNKARETKLLLVEHPRYGGRQLVAPASFDEETPNVYRFKVTIGASTSSDFVVREKQVFSESITLLSNRPTAFLSYSTNSAIPRAVRDALIRAGELHAAVTAVNSRISELTREKTGIENGQGRLRSNIETLGRTTPEGQRFLARLMEGEDRIEELEGLLVAAAEELKTAQAALDNYLKTLTVR